MWNKRLYAVLTAGALALGIALVTGVPATAQDPTPAVPDDAVNAIAKEMYCPVCENIPLDVCGTTACQQWRDLIRQMLAEGSTEAEIKAYFVEQYGDRVLAEPPRRGLNWLVYVIPPVSVLLGVFFVYRVLKSWKTTLPEDEVMILEGQAESTEGAEAAGISQDYLQRVEEALKKHDS